MKTSKFTNAVVIITGAASGMGQYMAVQAAQRGGYVIATDVNVKGLVETQAMAHSLGFTIETQYLDVSNKTEIDAFASTISPILNNRKLILINNAGIGLMAGDFNDTPIDEFEKLININLWGVIRMTKAFYPYFIAQNQGHIVNISSIFGFGGMMHQSAYCTAKFGVRGFTESLRMELMETNIGTTSVHPGGIKTNIVRNSKPIGHFATDAMHQASIIEFDKNAMTTAESAARQILDAVENNKKRLIIGLDGKLFAFVIRLFPVSFTRILKSQIERVFTNPYKKQA
jgi:NAD(P)-dependent dehydrogenase (short-subunit alcohol dehydrogenase family)